MKQIHKSIELYDAKISFVSLVDRLANGRAFLLTKPEGDDKPEGIPDRGENPQAR